LWLQARNTRKYATVPEQLKKLVLPRPFAAVLFASPAQHAHE